MKKYILVLCLLLLLLSSCQATKTEPACADLGLAVGNALPNGVQLTHVDEDFLETTFDFITKTEDHVLLLDTSDSGTREIGIFKTADGTTTADVEHGIRDYLKSEQEALSSLCALYPTDDLTERLWRYQNATVMTKGAYVAYFVLSQNDTKTAKSAFLGAFND